jgi:hypothetical protein
VVSPALSSLVAVLNLQLRPGREILVRYRV